MPTRTWINLKTACPLQLLTGKLTAYQVGEMINERVLEADDFTGSPILAAIITASLRHCVTTFF
ncbi:hypothetical [Yersinia pestis KIM10+]|uniref:Uncharacterized protein n=1 Tax=Yersinia pestis TaxID=632 RepID=Q8CLH1_YERPE|nr:hypothetical [Yersinia pestis KIM10+]EEO89936.1 hypothetical protein YPS_2938 [Yersinia pestis Pestoides A]